MHGNSTRENQELARIAWVIDASRAARHT